MTKYSYRLSFFFKCREFYPAYREFIIYKQYSFYKILKKSKIKIFNIEKSL